MFDYDIILHVQRYFYSITGTDDMNINDKLWKEFLPEFWFSVGLLQMPCFSLTATGFYMAIKQFGFTKKGFIQCLCVLPVILLPYPLFRILEFVVAEFFTVTLLDLIIAYALPGFWGNRDDDFRYLVLNVNKIYFDCVPQLIFQSIIIIQKTYDDIQTLQILSILANFCFISFTVTNMYNYIPFDFSGVESQDTDNQVEHSKGVNLTTRLKKLLLWLTTLFIDFIKLKVFQLCQYFIYLPLIGSNIIFNIGTMILSLMMYRYCGIIYIFFLIALTFTLCRIAPLVNVKNMYSIISCLFCNAKLSISDSNAQNRNWETELNDIKDENGKLRLFLTSFIAPILLFRPLEKPNYANMLYMIMTQIVPLSVNFCSLIIICIMYSLNSRDDFPEHALYIAITLYFFGFFFAISLIMYTRAKMQIK